MSSKNIYEYLGKPDNMPPKPRNADAPGPKNLKDGKMPGKKGPNAKDPG